MQNAETPATSHAIGMPYFAWTDHDISQEGVTIPAYEGRECPECGIIVSIKTTKGEKEIQSHYQKNHS